MKTSILRLVVATSATALTACGSMNRHQNEAPQEKPLGSNRYLQDASSPQQPDSGNPDISGQQPASNDSAPPTTPPDIESAGAATGSATPPPAPPSPTSQYPYGKPVPGKKGFVSSPYDDKAGMIDVRDYAPGTKVRDPYTNKIFLVP